MNSTVTHRRITTIAALLACTSALSACGGGGGGSNIASAPSPTVVSTEVSQTKPLNPTPGITTGNYDAIALVDGVGVASAGTVSIAVDAAVKTYTLTINAGAFRPPAARFGWAPEHLGMEVSYVDRYSDGSTKPAYTQARTTAGSELEIKIDDTTRDLATLTIAGAGTRAAGGRHVSLGYWAFDQSKLNTSGSYDSTDKRNSGYFVFGDRTAPGDIPVSGTARYTIVNELGDGDDCWDCSFAIADSTSLSVDFGLRSIAAAHRSGLRYELYEGPVGTRVLAGTILVTTDASGSSPIANNGTFDIAMSGTGSSITERIDKAPVDPASIPVSGRIAGAFFGPQAGEIGGVYSMPSAGFVTDYTLGVGQYVGAFSAVRTVP